MSLVEISWHPDQKALRQFGIVVLLGLGLFGVAFQFFLGQPQVATGLYIAGLVLGLPALSGTIIGRPGYWLWMGIAFVLGNIMSRVLLSLIYYLLFWPIGFIRRALGNDRLRLRKRPTNTYWVDVDADPENTRFERQF